MNLRPFPLPAARLLLLFVALAATNAHAWWNKDWTARKKLTVDTSAATGAEIAGPIGGATVLVRLHEGNFDFTTAREDGSDIRFVTEDDKTVLPSQVDKYDPLLNEALVWVRLPEVKPGGQTAFWLYSANAEAEPEKDAKPPYDAEAAVVYQFERAGAPTDSSGQKNNAETGADFTEGALVGPGLRLLGDKVVTIPGNPATAFADGGALTWSAWVKQTLAAPDAVLFDRQEGSAGFRIGLANGTPYVEIRNGSTQRANAPEPLALNAWAHLAVVVDGQTTTLYVNGKSAAVLNAGLSALAAPAYLGGGADASVPKFVGEVDAFQLIRAALPAGAIQLAALGQAGGGPAEKLLQFGEPEGGHGGHNATLEHVMLFGDIAKNMMFDGWIAVGVCVLMMIVGWGVAAQKLIYLNKIQKGSDEFLRQWANVSTDLTAIDHRDAESVKTLGGTASPKIQKLMKQSPLYHIYHIGSEEIRHRLERKDGTPFTGLSGRSIQAIRASLEAGLTRELTRLNDKLVFLTISIAGGPYVGLLGTVVGVMITFAVIAKSGDVDVNSIAPGIASALLATVFGLLVAIPALFIYSYLSARIKDATTNMQIFIDEFVTKMAEFYPAPGDHPGHDLAKGSH